MLTSDEKRTRWIMKSLRPSLELAVAAVVKMNFNESRQRFCGLLSEITQRTSTALPGQELGGLVAHAFEVLVLAKRLGFMDDGPLIYEYASGTDSGLAGITFTFPRGGIGLYVRVATVISPETRRSIADRLAAWTLASASQTPNHFQFKLKKFNESIDEYCETMVRDMRTSYCNRNSEYDLQPTEVLKQSKRPPSDDATPARQNATTVDYKTLIPGLPLCRSTLRNLARRAKLEPRTEGKKNKRVFTLQDVQAMAAIHRDDDPEMVDNWEAFIKKYFSQ